MSGSVTNLVNWFQGGSNAGAHTLDTSDIAPASYTGGRCLLVLCVATGGVTGTGTPSITSVVTGTSTAVKPTGVIGTWTRRCTQGFNGGGTGLVEIWTADASGSFSNLDVAISFANSTNNMAFALFAVQGQIEPTTFVLANNVQTTGGNTVPTVTAAAVGAANSVQIGIAIGDGNSAAASVATGYTGDEVSNNATWPSATGHKINSSAPATNTFAMGTGSTYPRWAAAILSFKTGAAEGTITTALKKISQAMNGLSNAEVGTIRTTLTKMSMSASGTSGPSGESGTIATHLSGISMSLSGTISPAGTIQTHLTGLSQSASGHVSEEFGTISTHLLGLSQSANGVVAATAGHIVTALPTMSQAAQGEEIVVGDVTTNLDNAFGMRVEGTALEEFIATITTNLPGILISAEAEEIFVADATTNLFPISQALSGDIIVEGSVLTALGRAGQFMTTFVEALEIIEGPIVTNLSGVETHALGGLMGSPGTGKFYSWRSPDS